MVIFFTLTQFLNKNNLVYLENTTSDKIFIIYQGSCRLVKNTLKLNQHDMTNPSKMKNRTLLIYEKGNIAGLEAINGQNYNYSLYVMNFC